MTKQADGPIPSQTALFTALRRALANRAYHRAPFGPDDLAIHFLPPDQRLLFHFHQFRLYGERKLEEAMPGMTGYVIARTAWLDRLFLHAFEDCTPQIVILGAGYDTRALRFADAHRATTVFELDAPATQARKRECLRSAHLEAPPFLRFVPIDFLHESPGDVLQGAGFSMLVPTLFLWEGVTYYLDARSVDETLAFVCTAGAGQATIAFDYTIPLTPENLRESFGSETFLEAMRSYHEDEALMFAIPDGWIEAFLRDRGLRVIEHYDPEAIEQAFLIYGQGALLSHVTGNFRFVVARSAAQLT